MQALHAFENTAVRQTGHLDSEDVVSAATRRHERSCAARDRDHAECAVADERPINWREFVTVYGEDDLIQSLGPNSPFAVLS